MTASGPGDAHLVLHASAVAFGHRGLLITGASGAGKSGLAIQLIALGADLVADDAVAVTRRAEGGLLLAAPESIAGMIEARGLGLLTASPVTALAAAVVDLDTPETERLPERRSTRIAGEDLPLLRRVESPAFASMLKLYLTGGRAEP